MKSQPSPRRLIGLLKLTLLRPVLRYSPPRDAYILRIFGGRRGSVYQRRATPSSPPPPRVARRS